MNIVKKLMLSMLLVPFVLSCSNGKTEKAEDGSQQSKAATNAKEITCVFAGSLYPEAAEAMAINMFAGALDYRIRTNPELAGKYTFSVKDKGILFGTAEECITGVSTGAAEMTLGAPHYLATMQPEWKLVGTPGVFDSWDHFMRTLDTPEWRELQDKLAKDKGVTIVKWMMNSGDWYLFTQKGPINSVADMNGQTIRIAGGSGFAKSLQNMGVTPVTLPYTEVITSLQTNMIDGLLSDMPSALMFFDLPAHTKYCVPISWAIQPQCWVVGTEFWESLPDNERQAMQDVFDRIDVSMYFNNISSYFDHLWASNPDLEMVKLDADAEAQWKEAIGSGAVEEVSGAEKDIIQAIERSK